MRKAMRRSRALRHLVRALLRMMVLMRPRGEPLPIRCCYLFAYMCYVAVMVDWALKSNNQSINQCVTVCDKNLKDYTESV